MKLTIDRNIWLRGEGDQMSCLLRESDQKRCCVGIYLGALGIPDGALRDRKNAATIEAELPDSAQWLLELRIGGLYTINDQRMPERDREDQIAEGFRNHGVEVEFVG